MFRLTTVLAAAGLAAVLGLTAGCTGADPAADAEGGADAKPTFRFTAIPDQDSTRLMERFGAVAAHLEAELGVPVEYVPVKTYAASVAAFENDEVQLAWFGGLTGVQARRAVADSRAIAQGADDPNFKSYIIVNTDTGIERSEEFPAALEGRSFTFGSKSSTSGRLMPEYYIRARTDVAPDEYFGSVGFSGDHSKTIDLVETGAYEAGAVNYKVWDSELAAGEIDPERVRVVWTTPGYPDYNWTIRGDVDATFGEGFADRVQQAIIEMDDPKLLAAFERDAFIAAENADFQPIEETAIAIGLIRD